MIRLGAGEAPTRSTRRKYLFTRHFSQVSLSDLALPPGIIDKKSLRVSGVYVVYHLKEVAVTGCNIDANALPYRAPPSSSKPVLPIRQSAIIK